MSASKSGFAQPILSPRPKSSAEAPGGAGVGRVMGQATAVGLRCLEDDVLGIEYGLSVTWGGVMTLSDGICAALSEAMEASALLCVLLAKRAAA